MRVLAWAEFAKCPVGTVFQILDHGSGLGELQILGDVWKREGEPRDFISASLMPDLRDRPSFGSRADRVLPADSDAPTFIVVPSLHGRDGLFEFKDRSFLVWDEEDRRRLAGWLLDPYAAVARQNDDPAVLIPLTVDQSYLP